ncbi:M1 family aminopeptidase [Pontibacter vulgaris]|uniref:M1 family aminopeptidase n=1 Tax=Pontibacter vulgaris TaxID=2905679 RepID=UPI001FA7E42B|nr:M1 family aminopeptidase [Pontibacter vulgaris]
MQKKLLLSILLIILQVSGNLSVAQQLPGIASCAESRINNTQRQAVAAPSHQQRMNQYDVTFYKLDLKLERNTTYIEGSVTTEAKLKTARLDTFAFELHPAFTIESISINGQLAQSINRTGSDVTVEIPAPVLSPAKLTAIINYKGTAPNSGNAAIGNGFSSATEPQWGNQVTWSLSEPYAAYEWWPSKQVLTDKADSVHVFVTTSSENKAGSNGLLTNTVKLPDNKVRYEWKSRYPIAYYLISVAVSNYEEYLVEARPNGASKPIPVVNYVYRGAVNLYRNEMNGIPMLIEHFSDLFTLYPFAAEKYGHSMAPIGGGMEHQTMTTQSSFNFTLTAHELAHQWFGDNVTCASWSDIWLNEGFASYAEFLALQKYNPAGAREWMLFAHNAVLQRLNGSLRVPDTTNVNRIFDYRLSYKKGAAVLHMLRYTINNDQVFFQALRNYQQKYKGSTASTTDLQRVFEETSKLNLDYFFEQWYLGEGWPTFNVEWNQEGNQIVLASTQTPSGLTPFFKTDVTYKIQTTEEDITVRVPHNEPAEQYVLRVKGTVTGIETDPDNWLLNNNTQALKNENLVVPAPEQPLLYPNPAYTFLKLAKLNFIPVAIEIYDRTGRLVKRLQQTVNEETAVPVADLPAGMYILQVSDGTNYHRATFIKL